MQIPPRLTFQKKLDGCSLYERENSERDEELHTVRWKQYSFCGTIERMNKRIGTNPKVMVGKPIIKGTRITVELILRQLAQGLTAKDILTNYPHIKQEDIQAAIRFTQGEYLSALHLRPSLFSGIL